MQSENKVNQTKEIVFDVEGVEVKEVIEEEVPHEQVLKYIPQGNYKWYVAHSSFNLCPPV